jgi:hypothetical protein
MARAMQQIKQDLATLEETVANFAVELRKLYRKYLEVLSEATRKQLVLASYQICTQVYPESFLELSVGDREKLQEFFKRLGKDFESQLLEFWENQVDFDVLDQKEEVLLSDEDELEAPQEIENEGDDNDENDQNNQNENIEDLVQWCKNIEEGIRQSLEDLSQEANFYLQKNQILPPQIPVKVLEMAMQTDGGNIPVNDSPNLLNLIVETERSHEETAPSAQETANITKVVAINLRLPEIEFSNPMLSIERDRLRRELERLSKMRKHYRHLQKELASAEAEAAWRATWFES